MKFGLQVRSFTTILPLFVLLTVQAQGPNYPPEISDAEIRTFKAIDGHELNLWVLEPDDLTESNPRPAVVFFFGGGFTGGSPGQFQRQARILASRGVVGILADYRVSTRHGTLPEHSVEDAKSAIRWVRENSSQLNIDPNRIGAAGGSSGGHLAASTATLSGFERSTEDLRISSKPNALALFNPLVIVEPIEGLAELSDEQRSRFGRDDLVSISPYHNLNEQHPPTLIVHGTADDAVLISSAFAYCDEVVKLQGECEVVSYEEAEHGFFNISPYFESTAQEMEEFFESLGWLD